jgi:hypothetical protein
MTCDYPHNTPGTAYWKGCRCERCRAAKSIVDKRRDRTPKTPCPSCGGRKAEGAVQCMPCSRRSVVDRIMDKIEIDSATGCWLFTGNRNNGGYGLISTNGSGRAAHRVLYEETVGPVADGLELDHLCRQPSCVNPDHLEPVDHTENMRRAVAARNQKDAALWREATAPFPVEGEK